MALSKKQRSVAEAIKGKAQGLRMMKLKGLQTDPFITKIINEINGLIDTHELSEEKELLDTVVNALVRLKKFGLASTFKRRHSKKR
jgi:hypothetical protein